MKLSRLFILLIIFELAFSQFAISEQNFSTPRETFKYFIEKSKKQDFESASKSMSMKELVSEETDAQLAEQLYKILKVKLLIPDLENIPNIPEYTDSITKENTFHLSENPIIEIEKVKNKWLFSEKTCSKTEDYYREYFPFTLSDIVNTLPGFLHDEIFDDLYLWQLLFLFILFLFSVVFYLIFKWIFKNIILNIAKRLKIEAIANNLLHPLSKPFSLIIIAIFFIAVLPILDLPYGIYSFLSKIFTAFIPAFGMVIGYKLCDIVADYLAKKAEKTETTVDDHLIPFARKLLKIFVIAFGLIYILQIFGVSIAPLLAGLSIGGLAFALAAQDTVKNLFGSLTIFTDQPFKIGDWIVFEGTEGTVEEVGIRSTRVRTFYDSVLSIPNGKLADIKVDNMGQREFRRYSTLINITYDSNVDALETFVKKLEEITLNHPKTRKDYYQIHINGFGEKGIEILFYIFFEVPDWTEELNARHQVISEILRAASDLELRFAYPIRDYSINPPS